MLREDIIEKHNLQLQKEEILEKPYFFQEIPLWIKNTGFANNLCPQDVKRFMFIKIGKTFGGQIIRYLALHKDRLFYFDSQENQACLGTCCIENIYLRWFKIEDQKRMLYLSNGVESSLYYFQDDSFYFQNKAALGRYVVQLDFRQKFELEEELGKGAYSTVFKARSKENCSLHTAKIIALDTPFLILQRELTVLRQLVGAQNVSQFQGVFECRNKLIILTKYLEGKDLMSVVKANNDLTAKDVKTILTGITKGLIECHKRNIIHRDIKPENIVINMSNMEPTIIDFGMVLNLKKQCEYLKCGTLAFMAPEVFNCEKTSLHYGTKSDLFCLGVIAHLMLDGQNPLRCKKQNKCEFDRTAKAEWNCSKLKENWGQCGLQMVTGLMNQNPCRRWDANKLLNCCFLTSQSKLTDSVSTTEDKHLSFSIGSY